MGIWNDLLSLLGWGEPAKPRAPSAPRPDGARHRTARQGLEAGGVLTGVVAHVGKKCAKVRADDVNAVVFLSEMSGEYVERASDVLHVGQAVDFVVLRPSEKRPDEWVVSISGASEARARAALSRLAPGERVDGRVSELRAHGILLDAGEYPVWVPITELAWSWLLHPSDAVSLGQTITIEILRVELPEGWLNDKRQRRARAVGSLRAMIPQPESPVILVAFSGLPFKMSAVAKTPHACDPVVLYLLEELVGSRSREDIQATTGLPRQTLDGVHQVLVSQGLVKNWHTTEKGRRLAEAVSLARTLNADPIRGFFVSSAHPSAQFATVGGTSATEYPRSWPRPPFRKRAEEQFARACDESIPELLINRIVTTEKRELLSRIQEDDRMRVFLRRDGSRSWKALYVPTDEHWLLAGLWRAFDPVGAAPFRPANADSRCRDFLMVRVRASIRNARRPVDTLYFETHTKTLWLLRDGAPVRFRTRDKRVFPDLTELEGKPIRLPSGEEVEHLLAESWCMVEVS